MVWFYRGTNLGKITPLKVLEPISLFVRFYFKILTQWVSKAVLIIKTEYFFLNTQRNLIDENPSESKSIFFSSGQSSGAREGRSLFS